MAVFIPELSKHTLQNMETAGERRVAKFLQEYLSDDCVVWCNVPAGRKGLYADFLVLMPQHGLLCLEVKDWKADKIRSMNKEKITLILNDTLKHLNHPLNQARGYIHNIVGALSAEKRLLQSDGLHQGRLNFPYAYGAVFTNCASGDFEKLGVDGTLLDAILPHRQMLYKDMLASGQNRAAVQVRLAQMFAHRFGLPLEKERVDLIRWHLFPEVRILPQQQDLFAETAGAGVFRQPEHHTPEQQTKLPENTQPAIRPLTAPDIIKIMDIQQEQLAYSMGGGHRVIHGVAGSGKTLILGLRCKYLAGRTAKPLLILCYNITLAAKLRSMMADKGLADRVQVHHFHGWCSRLVKEYGIAFNEAERLLPYYEAAVQAAIRAMAGGLIPKGRYGAVLIDEGHDFEADWLRLAVSALDEKEENLLLLYDDAQSIYHSGKQLKFSLKSVGIKASGRTTVLKLNYRNTKEIIGFAHFFAHAEMQPRSGDDETVPLVEPEAAGMNGDAPFIKSCKSWQDELDYLERCLDKWLPELPLGDIAVICPKVDQCADVATLLRRKNIPYQAMHKNEKRRHYNPTADKITVITAPSSKGLEFKRVILAGIGAADCTSEQKTHDTARLLYVAMTRAQSHLLVTFSGSTPITVRMQNAFAQWQDSLPKAA